MLGMDAHFSVIDLGRRSEPGVVVEVLRNRHGWGIGAAGVARQADLDMLDGPDAAIAHQFARSVKLLP
jgi:hypothetical protein